MTEREINVQRLKSAMDICAGIGVPSTVLDYLGDAIDFLKMPEPCDDCISREAVRELKPLSDKPAPYLVGFSNALLQAVNLPSVMPQEPCEDAVSREAAIAEVMWFPQCHTDTIHWTRMKARLERLPTVTPKAQEPVEPFMEYSVHTGSKWICCGACESPMVKATDENKPKFCSECGREVKWNV